MSPQFIFYKPSDNTLVTYFYSTVYKMFSVTEQVLPGSDITVTQFMGRTSFAERANKERDAWVYIGQI